MIKTRLLGKVAIVTGASQGLGEHLAIELAEQGAAVALAARNEERLGAVQRTIEERGGRAIAVPTNLAREEDCGSLVARARDALGPIDILVLNAGNVRQARGTGEPSADP